MEDEREKRLREESERAYQRWLKESGRTEERKAPKPSKKRPNIKPRAVLNYLALCAVFFVAVFGLGWVFSFLSKLPGLGTIPGWVLPLASALLAWGITAVVGQKLTTTKRSLFVATACLAAFMVVSAIPSPPHVDLPPPSPVPEGYVEFYYQASFTFLGGATDTISNVELWLPWPYIDTKETRPIAKPVGLDNWLHKAKGHVFKAGPAVYVQPTLDFLVNVLKPHNNEISIDKVDNKLSFSIDIENGIWSTDYYPVVDYSEVENVKIIYNGTPSFSAHFGVMEGITMLYFQKILVYLPSMNQGESISVEYHFFVSEENSKRIRIDDWLESYDYAIEMKHSYENAPAVAAMYDGPPISCEFTASLHKNIGGNWEKVAYYKRKWDSWRSGFGLVTNS